jgi:hypothetical protein
MYTFDGCAHIAWSAPAFDSAAGTVTSQAAMLRHWDDCVQCISLAIDATNFDAGGSRGAWNKNVGKMNLTECTVGANKLLYLTYTRFLSDDADATPDHSAAGFGNGEIFAQASSTGGQTWGPPVNLTNTTSANCTINNCMSEHWSSSAQYVTDSLRIFYVEDKDAGGIVQTEGGWTNSPVKNLSHPCFSMATFTSLSVSPAEFTYPYHTAPSQVLNEPILMTNSGNTSTNWSVTDNAAWITYSGPTSGSVGAGCTNTGTFTAVITGPGTEGYYTGQIDVTYSSPDKDAQAVVSIPVELYNFTNFYLPVNAALRTNINRMNVNQASQIAAAGAQPGRMFSYFADTSDYLYDGHLIIGNSANNLSYSVFDANGAPTPSNPYGYTYAATATTTHDSTTFTEYRKASGKGYNRDTTIEFSEDWYASKHPALGNFYVGIFKVYKGPKNPSGSISNLSIAYYTDWDVPSDSGSDNTASSDATRNAIIQRGAYSAPNDLRYGATAVWRHTGSIVGGWVLDNPTYIYPEVGYENDSVWNIMQLLSAGQYRLWTGQADDLSGAVLAYKGQTLNGAANDTLKFAVFIAGTRNSTSAGTVAAALDSAKAWTCRNNLLPGAAFCSTCNCGNANSDASINISDVVYLINYIFGGGPQPNPKCNGNANGDAAVNISDVVYLINYIFGGGPAPVSPCPVP